MNQGHQARLTVQRLSEAERDALKGMINGESIASLAHRRRISTQHANTLRLALKSRLGVESDAEAVRIGLLADISGNGE